MKTVDSIEFPDYVLHKIEYESRLGEPVPAFLLIPNEIQGPVPAVICPHGHVSGGKDSVVLSNEHGAPYGAKLAEMGFVTLCPDNAGMGERGDDGGCELLWSRLNYLGLDVTGYRVFDLIRGTDLLCSLPEVNETRIGTVGFSLGCWLAMVHAALDERIRACVLSGRFTTFAQTLWYGRCICQHVTGIGELCEMPDIIGLIAPRPVCAEWGTEDVERPVYPAYQMTRRIYEAAGATDQIDLKLFNGNHRFDGEQSLHWLAEKLTGEAND
jgi:dienelactone hydrolase